MLIWTEQGLGDCIQFIRLASYLAQKGAVIDIMLPKQHASLADLLDSVNGIDQVFVIQTTEVVLSKRYDYHSPLMSLMKHIKLAPSNIPEIEFPYVSAPKVQRFDLPNILSNRKSALKIGLVWTTALKQSFKKNNYMHFKQKLNKSLSSDEVLPLLRLGDDFEFFSLHLEKSPALQHVLDTENILDLSGHMNSFNDTAHLIDAMDMVVSIDTSVAHIAGALGKPVINLLPLAADWRWQSQREDTPWYPTMRLLRQSFRDDWSNVVERLTKLLLKTQTQYQQTGEVSVFK